MENTTNSSIEEQLKDFIASLRPVDDKGVNRLVISNQDKMPPPIIAGKEYKRHVAPSGIIRYDEKDVIRSFRLLTGGKIKSLAIP